MIEVYRSLEAVPQGFGPSAATIGNFDGVHLGHRAILSRCVEEARACGAKSVAVIFDPHPLEIVAPGRAPRLMTTPEQRVARFGELGLDAVLILPFTERVRNLTPEEFVVQVLVERLRAAHVVVGSNFRFGHKHAGDVSTLTELGRRYGFTAEAAPEIRLGDRVVSSSAVRALVETGDVAEARALLGDDFRLEGGVVAGRGIGSKQTVPTLNLAPDTELLPADGVYVTETRLLPGAARLASVTNVGVRPTFGESGRVVETHLLAPIDGGRPERIEIRFLQRLRPERKFSQPEELKQQILADVAAAERYFERSGVASGDS